MNETAYGLHPGIMTVAEESTSFPKVSAPVDAGGLGFGYKWNMGWMNDTLKYVEQEPVHRKWHHHQMTFGLAYAFNSSDVGGFTLLLCASFAAAFLGAVSLAATGTADRFTLAGVQDLRSGRAPSSSGNWRTSSAPLQRACAPSRRRRCTTTTLHLCRGPTS